MSPLLAKRGLWNFMNSSYKSHKSEFKWLIRVVLQTKLTPSAECAVRYFTRKPHVLAGCSSLAQTKYMDRHNDARKVLFFEMLRDLKLADSVWPCTVIFRELL